ncbi:hypothetical protein Q5P01_012057 [Channa striata]|uniref:HECT domain-containing protein n=1 Tax=Channa striata TaxID=64152 RepID=A0AA88MNR5_CHASR|nr:hypothetical protein Q5P01_012057 [Channa striata]
MFSWGENCQQSFRVKAGTRTSTADGVHFLNLSYQIRDLSAAHNVLAFIKTNGDAFIIRTYESTDGRRVRGKQKFVDCKTKIQAVSCGDDKVTLLSETGTVLCVDTTEASFSPSIPDALCHIPVCQVACGNQHSVALTKDGRVFTWGQDSRGQLGLGNRSTGTSSPQHLRSLSDIPLVQVAAGGEHSFALSVSGGVFGWGRNDCGQLGLGDTTELWGAKVTKIACGRHHTLVLTDSKRIYSFGCGEQGQLGPREAAHASVPLRVQLPQDANDGKNIWNIYAGENFSFATYTSNEGDRTSPNTDTTNYVTPHSIDDMINNWTCEYYTKQSWKKNKMEIHKMFSSASCVNRSFLDHRKDKHFQTSSRYSGLDLLFAHRKLKKLVRNGDVLKEVEAAALLLVSSLDKNPVGEEGLRIYLLLNELLHAIQKHHRQLSTKLAVAVAAALQRLSAESLQIIEDWWCSVSASTLVKYVQVWKQALSEILSTEPVPRDAVVISGVKTLLLVLRHMYHANNRSTGCQRIPNETYCLGINQELLIEDLNLWRTQKAQSMNMNRQPLILHNFPFVMDLQSKKLLFDIDAERTQRDQQTFMPLIGWVARSGSGSCFFELMLTRGSLLDDTFQQLAAAPRSDYKKPLVVYFDENPKVTDVYKRDFFHHLFHEMVSAKSEMFMFNDSKTLAWFSSRALDRTNFFLFGLLCGLALYNQCIVHLPFPLALFKKLLDTKPTLEDLMDFSPSVGESLKCILDYEDDVLENLDMCFLISWDGTDVDLDPQNPEKPVTSQNKKEFVDAYVNHVFNASVETAFQEFRRGFFQVCDQDLVKLFRPKELQGVLVGQEVYDWAKLKQNTLYQWEFHPGHPTIQMFWEVFDDLTEDQKKDFLWFLTGFRRVPILGMEQIQMKVRVKLIESGSYDQHFPESLTCHSILELPLYSTKKIMRRRLTQALIPNKGFLM